MRPCPLRSAASPSLLIALVIGALLAGCGSTPLRSLTEVQLLERRDAYLRAYDADLKRMAAVSAQRIERDYLAGAKSDGGDGRTLDFLALSGGGAYGAFGAGFLQGWGEVTEPGFERPRFDQVSGISTGALIAPFAFVGTDETYDTLVDLYRNPSDDWIRPRGMFPFLPGNVSLLDVTGLNARIREAISPELVAAVAAEVQRDRQLVIGATNIDYGLLRVWDLAWVASSLPPDEARERMVDILLASAAIPGVFPPVAMDDHLYVDGGAAMQLVGGIDEREWIKDPDPSRLRYVDPERPLRIRAWTIVNQKLLPEPMVVEERWPAIGTRSLSSLVRTSTLQSIQDAVLFLHVLDGMPGVEAELRFVAIPQDFEIANPDELFDAEAMNALVDLGRRMGADPSSWRTETLRPGAPFTYAEE